MARRSRTVCRRAPSFLSLDIWRAIQWTRYVSCSLCNRALLVPDTSSALQTVSSVDTKSVFGRSLHWVRVRGSLARLRPWFIFRWVNRLHWFIFCTFILIYYFILLKFRLYLFSRAQAKLKWRFFLKKICHCQWQTGRSPHSSQARACGPVQNLGSTAEKRVYPGYKKNSTAYTPGMGTPCRETY